MAWGEGPRSLELCAGDRPPTPFTTAEGGPSCLTSDPNLQPPAPARAPCCACRPLGPSLPPAPPPLQLVAPPPSLRGSRPDHRGPSSQQGALCQTRHRAWALQLQTAQRQGPRPGRVRVSRGPRALSGAILSHPGPGWAPPRSLLPATPAMWAARAQDAGRGPGGCMDRRQVHGACAEAGRCPAPLSPFPHLQTPLSRTAVQTLRVTGRSPRHTEAPRALARAPAVLTVPVHCGPGPCWGRGGMCVGSPRPDWVGEARRRCHICGCQVVPGPKPLGSPRTCVWSGCSHAAWSPQEDGRAPGSRGCGEGWGVTLLAPGL